MHKCLLILLLTITFFSCDIRNGKDKPDVKASQTSASNTKDSTTVKVIDSVYNFGKITDGEKVEYNFRFINTGKNPLIISEATASCGCTVPEKPEEPIRPGETGFLKVVFDSHGRVGSTHKDVTVVSNAKPAFPVLQLQGEVLEKKK